MYYFYNTTEREPRKGWRSAAEIEAAAIEHEKQQYRMWEAFSSMQSKAKVKSQWQSGSAAVFTGLLLLLFILMK